MKMITVTDPRGKILSTVRLQESLQPDEAKNAPASWGITPLSGQRVHEIDVPENIALFDSIAEFSKQYKVQLKSGRPTLVKTSPQQHVPRAPIRRRETGTVARRRSRPTT